jgi:hypothetical protein
VFLRYSGSAGASPSQLHNHPRLHPEQDTQHPQICLKTASLNQTGSTIGFHAVKDRKTEAEK